MLEILYKTLNIGCGDSTYGTNRLDITRDSKATELGLATQMPYKDNSFHYIYAENVLAHQPNPIEFLIECKRVLKKGDFLSIITDNAGYRGFFPLLNKFQDKHGTYSNPKTDKDKHYMIFTVDHIKNLINKAGLKLVYIWLGTRWKPTMIQRLWTRISPTIGHSHIYVLVQK